MQNIREYLTENIVENFSTLYFIENIKLNVPNPDKIYSEIYVFQTSEKEQQPYTELYKNVITFELNIVFAFSFCRSTIKASEKLLCQ